MLVSLNCGWVSYAVNAGMLGMQYNWYVKTRSKKDNKYAREQKGAVVRTLLV
jgi:hypothetical protein